jgi:hypothetical protein
MKKTLKKALIDFVVAVLASYVVVLLPLPGTSPNTVPALGPRMIMVWSSDISLDVASGKLSKLHRIGDLECVDA